MTSTEPGSPATPEAPSATGQLTDLRGLVAHATQALLGDCISVSDEDWAAPSRLPGWSRAHVATHLARQADAVGRLVEWARTGTWHDMYERGTQRDDEIDAGAGRSGLDLQIDLDTSADRLGDAFESLDAEHGKAWEAVVELRGGLSAPARLLPLARLTEVVLHHIDLDVGVDAADVDETTAEWLLEWAAFRLHHRDEFPALQLTSTSGFSIAVGSSGAPIPVSGTSAELLGWLTGRTSDDHLGGPGLVLPSF